MVVFAALIVGVLVGLIVRPIVDAYLHWKTAQSYADLPMTGAEPESVHAGRDRQP